MRIKCLAGFGRKHKYHLGDRTGYSSQAACPRRCGERCDLPLSMQCRMNFASVEKVFCWGSFEFSLWSWGSCMCRCGNIWTSVH